MGELHFDISRKITGLSRDLMRPPLSQIARIVHEHFYCHHGFTALASGVSFVKR